MKKVQCLRASFPPMPLGSWIICKLFIGMDLQSCKKANRIKAQHSRFPILVPLEKQRHGNLGCSLRVNCHHTYITKLCSLLFSRPVLFLSSFFERCFFPSHGKRRFGISLRCKTISEDHTPTRRQFCSCSSFDCTEVKKSFERISSRQNLIW